MSVAPWPTVTMYESKIREALPCPIHGHPLMLCAQALFVPPRTTIYDHVPVNTTSPQEPKQNTQEANAEQARE